MNPNRRPLGTTVAESIELNRSLANRGRDEEEAKRREREAKERESASAGARKEIEQLERSGNEVWRERATQKGKVVERDPVTRMHRQREDESGRGLWKEQDWEFRGADDKGVRFEESRDQHGTVSRRVASIKPGEDLADPYLYFPDGEKAGHVDDIVKMGEGAPEHWREIAAKRREDRKKAKETYAAKQFDDNINRAKSERLTAEARQREVLEPELGQLSARLQEIESDPEWSKSGGWFRKQSPANERLQKEHERLSERYRELNNEFGEISNRLDSRDGELVTAERTATAERDLWRAQTSLGKHEDVLERRRAVLEGKGLRPDQVEADPIYQQLQQKVEAFGREESEYRQSVRRYQEAYEAGRREAIGDYADVLDMDPLFGFELQEKMGAAFIGSPAVDLDYLERLRELNGDKTLDPLIDGLRAKVKAGAKNVFEVDQKDLTVETLEKSIETLLKADAEIEEEEIAMRAAYANGELSREEFEAGLVRSARRFGDRESTVRRLERLQEQVMRNVEGISRAEQIPYQWAESLAKTEHELAGYQEELDALLEGGAEAGKPSRNPLRVLFPTQEQRDAALDYPRVRELRKRIARAEGDLELWHNAHGGKEDVLAELENARENVTKRTQMEKEGLPYFVGNKGLELNTVSFLPANRRDRHNKRTGQNVLPWDKALEQAQADGNLTAEEAKAYAPFYARMALQLQTVEDAGVLTRIGKSTWGGQYGFRSSIVSVLAMGAGYLGQEGEAKRLAQTAAKLKAAGGEYMQYGMQFRDVENTRDGMLAVGTAMSSMLYSVVPIMIGGQVGGKAFAMGGPYGVMAGSFLGSFSTGLALYGGDIYSELIEYGVEPERARYLAMRGGVPASGASIIWPMMLNATILKGRGGATFYRQSLVDTSKRYGAAMGKQALKGAPVEGSAEWIAQGSVIHARRLAGVHVSQEEERIERLEAGAAGGLMGATTGATAGTRMASRMTPARAMMLMEKDLLQATVRAPAFEQALIELFESMNVRTAEQDQVLELLKSRPQLTFDEKAAAKQIEVIDQTLAKTLKWSQEEQGLRIVELMNKGMEGMSVQELQELAVLMANNPGTLAEMGMRSALANEMIDEEARDSAEANNREWIILGEEKQNALIKKEKTKIHARLAKSKSAMRRFDESVQARYDAMVGTMQGESAGESQTTTTSEQVATAQDGQDAAFSVVVRIPEGEEATHSIPVGATLSTGEAVNESNAGQWLAENGVEVSEVLSVEAVVSEPVQEPQAQEERVPGRVFHEDIATRLEAFAQNEGVELNNETVGRMRQAARRVADSLNAALEKYAPIFGDNIVISNESGEAGGPVGIDTKTGALTVRLDKITTTAELNLLLDNPARAEAIIREEALHKVIIDSVGNEKVRAIYEALPELTKEELNRKIYPDSGNDANKSLREGHEFFRMMLDGRLQINEKGEAVLDGAVLTEETLSPKLVEQIRDALRAIRNYFRDLAGSLQKDGADERVINALDAELKKAEAAYSRLMRGETAEAAQAAASESTKVDKASTKADAIDNTFVANFAKEFDAIPKDEVHKSENDTEAELSFFKKHSKEQLEALHKALGEESDESGPIGRIIEAQGVHSMHLYAALNYYLDSTTEASSEASAPASDTTLTAAATATTDTTGSGDGTVGTSDTYRTLDGNEIEYHYELVEGEQVVDHPRNTKPGTERKETRDWVAKRSGPNYDVRFEYAVDPTFQVGPAMVMPGEDGTFYTMGGHRRRYLREANREQSRAALPKYAARFGIDPKAAAGMKDPVIVAVVDSQMSRAQEDSLVSQLNDSVQQGVSTAWRATALARKMTPELVEIAGRLFEGGEPMAMLQSGEASELSQAMVDAGVMSDADAKKYVAPNGSFTKSDQGGGAMLMKKVLLATVIDSPQILDRIEGTPLETKMLNAIGPLVTMIRRGQDRAELQAALEIESERLQLYPVPSVAAFQQQETMGFEETRTPETLAIQRFFETFNSKKAKAELSQLLSDAFPNEDPKQTGLFGESNRNIGEVLLERERGEAAGELNSTILNARAQSSDYMDEAAAAVPALQEQFDAILKEKTLPAGEEHKISITELIELEGKKRVAKALGLVRARIDAHRKHHQQFHDMIEEIAAGHFGRIFRPGVKGVPRSAEKLLEKWDKYTEEYGRPELGLRDILRDTIAVPTLSDVFLVLEQISSQMETVQAEDRMLVKKDPAGYKDFQLIVEPFEGINAEIQVNVPELLDAKAVGHAYYEKWRSNHGKPDIQSELVREQQLIYNAAWRLAVAKDIAARGSTSPLIQHYVRELREAISRSNISSGESLLGPGNRVAAARSGRRLPSPEVLIPDFVATNQSTLPGGNPPMPSVSSPGNKMNSSPSLSTQKVEPGGKDLTKLSTDSLIQESNTRTDADRQREILRAGKEILNEKRGKIQQSGLRTNLKGKNVARIAYPAQRKGLERKEMPQVPSAYKSAFIESLRREGLKVELQWEDAFNLRVSQAEIDGSMVEGQLANLDEASLNANPGLVSRENFIADGHHRWGIFAVNQARGNSGRMRVFKVDLPLPQLLAKIDAFNTEKGIRRRAIDDHNYGSVKPVTINARADESQMSLFDLLGGETADTRKSVETYAAKTPSKARKSKAEFKKQVSKDAPAIANSEAALGDLFDFAKNQKLTGDPSARIDSKGKEPSNEQTTTGDGRSTDRKPRTGKNLGQRMGASPGGEADLFDWASQPGREDAAGVPGEGSATDSQTDSGQVATGDGATGQTGVDPAGDGSGSDTGTAGSRRGTGRKATAAESRREADRVLRENKRKRLKPEDRNHTIARDEKVAPPGVAAKLTGNIEAIELLQLLEQENRNPTPAEKDKLAGYTGWGGLKQALDPRHVDLLEEGKRYSYVRGTPAYQEAQKWEERWGKHYHRLRELLSEEEFNSAMDSVLNAHYTSPEVIAPMWDAVQRLGFKGGTALETSGGIGHFFGLLPQSLVNYTDTVGVELDSLSGRIFAKLYPETKVHVTGFESAKIPNNSVDLAISNVPFAKTPPFDPAYKNVKLNLHNYFFAKALDKLKPGGLIAFITSSSTMENNPEQRRFLAGKGELIAAIRLPNTAFKGNANTEVTTDIIFMRKPDGKPFAAESWTEKLEVPVLDKSGNPVVETNNKGETSPKVVAVNEYFARNPQMVLGHHTLEGSMYRAESYAVLPDGRDIGAAISEAVETMPENVIQTDGESQQSRQVETDLKVGQFGVNEKGEYGVIGENDQWIPLEESDDAFVGEGKVAQRNRAKVRAFIPLRDHYRQHIELMHDATVTEAEFEASLQELQRLYEAWNNRFGMLNDSKARNSAMETDPEWFLAQGMEFVDEKVNEDTGAVEFELSRGDVLSKRTIYPQAIPEKADSNLDALRISQAFKGHLDVDFMADLRGVDADTLRKNIREEGIAFEDPKTGMLETRERYLSGAVVQKLREAREAAKTDPSLQVNVDALERVQPEQIPLAEINPRLGGGWLPVPVMEAFIREAFGGNVRSEIKVDYNTVSDDIHIWELHADPFLLRGEANSTRFAGGGMKGFELLEKALNSKTISVTKPGGEKGDKRVFDPEATAAARAAQERIQEAFGKFVRESTASVQIERMDGSLETRQVGELIHEVYNERFNGHTEIKFDGSHLTLPGAAPHVLKPSNEGGLRPHQKDGIWRAIQEGYTLLAHGVGSGKTNELIGISYEWRRLGYAKKPMVVVQNATLYQFATSYRKMYPGARILVADQKQLEGPKRKRFMARVAAGDWDAVIIAQSSFDMIPDDIQIERAWVNEQLKELMEIEKSEMDKLGSNVSKAEQKRNPTLRAVVQARKRLESRLEKALARDKDDTITFQQMGVDALLVDEAHEYKKVQFTTMMGTVAGLDTNSSQKAGGLQIKTRYIQGRHDGRNVVLATGTPVTNTLAEVWNMIRLTHPQTLAEFGVSTFDEFARQFATTESVTEQNPAGDWVQKERFSKFINGPELISMVRKVFDIKMSEDLDYLNRPDVAGGAAQPVLVPRTPQLNAYLDYLKSAYYAWKEGDGETKRQHTAIPLVVATTAKAATLDLRLVEPRAKDHPDSKVNTTVKEVFKQWKESTDRLGTQLIFADSFQSVSTDYLENFAGPATLPAEMMGESVRKGDKKFSIFEDMRKKLVAMGVPADQIAIINENDTKERRNMLFSKLNSGKVRILMGSTKKMGVGVNVQERLAHMHHLDAPWTPADREQRNGRGIRSGNLHYDWKIPVGISEYGVENSPDASRFGILLRKAKFIYQVLSGKSVGREFEDPASSGINELRANEAMFLNDKDAMRRVELLDLIRNLEMSYDAWNRRNHEIADKQNFLRLALQRKSDGWIETNSQGTEQVNPGLDGLKTEATIMRGVADSYAEGAKRDAAVKAINEAIDLQKEAMLATSKATGESGRIKVFDKEVGPSVRLTVNTTTELLTDGEGEATWRFNAEATVWREGVIAANAGITSGRGRAAMDALGRAAERAETRVRAREDEINHFQKSLTELESSKEDEFSEIGALRDAQAELQEIIDRQLGKTKEVEKKPARVPAESRDLLTERPGRKKRTRKELQLEREKKVVREDIAAYVSNYGLKGEKAYEAEGDLQVIAETLNARPAQGALQYEFGFDGEGVSPASGRADKPARSGRAAGVVKKPGYPGLTKAQLAARKALSLWDNDSIQTALEAGDGKIDAIFSNLVKDNQGFDIRGAVLSGPQDVAGFMRMIRSPYVETMKAIFVDENGVVLHNSILSVGSTQAALVDMRMFGREMGRHLAGRKPYGVYIAHNHPGGDPSPSQADIEVTKSVRETMNAAGVPLIDHVITNGDTAYSFRENGLIQDFHKPHQDNPQITVEMRAKSGKIYKDKWVQEWTKADYEAVPLSSLPTVINGEEVFKFRKRIDDANEYAFYLNQQGRVVGIEQMQDFFKTNPAELKERILAGLGRNGGQSFMIAGKGEAGWKRPAWETIVDPTQAHVIRDLQRWARNARIGFFDYVQIKQGTDQYLSYADVGILGEPSAADEVGSRSDGSQVEFDFDKPAAPTRGELFRQGEPLAMRAAAHFMRSLPGMTGLEVKQEARLALLKAAQSYNAELGEFEHYANRVIYNALKSAYRQEMTRAGHGELSLDYRGVLDGGEGQSLADVLPIDTPTPAQQAEATDRVELVQSLIDKLPPKPRELANRLLAGETYLEIARDTGVSKQAIHSRAQRLIALLGKQVAQRTGGLELNAREETAAKLNIFSEIELTNEALKRREKDTYEPHPIKPILDQIETNPDFPDAVDSGRAFSDAEAVARRGSRTIRNAQEKPIPKKRADLSGLDKYYKAEAKAIRSWATETGKVADREAFYSQWKMFGSKGGAEHHVYYDEKDHRWHKSLYNNMQLGSIRNYFERMAIFNRLFPESAYRLEGFHINEKNGEIQPYVSQADVAGTPVTKEAIAEMMEDKGFEPIQMRNSDAYNAYYNEQIGVLVYDLHLENALKNKNGKIVVIDAFIEVARDGSLAAFELERVGRKWPRDAEILHARANEGDEAAVRELLGKLTGRVPDASGERAAGQEEVAGERTVGRPDLAKVSADEAGRMFEDGMHEARKQDAEKQTHAMWVNEAKKLLANDREGVKRMLLEKAENPDQHGTMTAVEVKAAKMLVADMILEAIRSKDPAKMREVEILTWSYSEAGTEQARAFAARRDDFASPAERHREFFSRVLFRATREAKERMAGAMTMAEKSRMIDKLQKQLAAAERKGANERDLMKMRVELGKAQQAKTQMDVMTEANQQRLEKIEAALADLGVSFEDILSGEAVLRLRGAKVVSNYAEQLDERRRQVVEMLNWGLAMSDIRAATKFSQGEINDIIDDFRADFIAKNKAKFKKGLKAENVEVQTELFAQAEVSDAEAEMEMEKALARLGFGLGRQSASFRADMRKSRMAKKRGKDAKRQQRELTEAQKEAIRRIQELWETQPGQRKDRHFQRPSQAELFGPLAPPQFDIANPGHVMQAVRMMEAAEGTGMDIALELWLNAILSGPQTHMVNITTTYLTAAWDMTFNRGMETLINEGLKRVGKDVEGGAEFGEFKHMLRGMAPGFRDAIRGAMQTWDTESSLFTYEKLNEELPLGEFDVARVRTRRTAISENPFTQVFGEKGRRVDQFLHKTLGRANPFRGRVARISFRGLLFFDEFSKRLLSRMQVGAEAYRIASREGLSGEAMEKRISGLINTTGSIAWQNAVTDAVRWNFQNRPDKTTKEGRALQHLYELQNEHLWTRFFLPFRLTPYNIVKEAGRRSPMGAILLGYRTGKALYRMKDGKPFVETYKGRDAIRHASEQILSWGLTTMLYGAMAGDEDDLEKPFLITGKAPKNPGLREAYDRAGIPPYSFVANLPGGRRMVFTYARYQPIGGVIGLATDFVTAKKRKGQDGGESMLSSVTGTAAGLLMQTPMLQGVDSLVDLTNEPDRAGVKVLEFGSDVAAGFVPNALKQLLRAFDPTVRDYSLETGLDELPRRMTERTAKRAFPLAGVAPERIDVWGQPITKEGNVPSRLFSPTRLGEMQPSNRVDRTLVNFARNNPDEAWAPQRPSRRIMLDGEPYIMKDAEYVRFQQRAGQLAWDAVQRVPLNQANPDQRDIERIKRAVDNAREQARRELRRELGRR
jgi:RNA polymerase sigma factor (sigma-70 family)